MIAGTEQPATAGVGSWRRSNKRHDRGANGHGKFALSSIEQAIAERLEAIGADIHA
jgi:hypothetical protein